MQAELAHTRRALDLMSTWVDAFASRLSPPEQVPVAGRGFKWRHAEETPEVLQVAKAARMVAALRAALLLAESGYTTEAGTLLRTAADFADEITFLGEPKVTGQRTKAYERFVDQAFMAIPTSLGEWTEWQRERYVGREEVVKANVRLAEMAGQDGEVLRNSSRWLSHGYDRYVHGSYDSAMELYDGRSRTFKTAGVDSPRLITSALTAVAWKTGDGLMALEFMGVHEGAGRAVPCDPAHAPNVSNRVGWPESAMTRWALPNVFGFKLREQHAWPGPRGASRVAPDPRR